MLAQDNYYVGRVQMKRLKILSIFFLTAMVFCGVPHTKALTAAPIRVVSLPNSSKKLMSRYVLVAKSVDYLNRIGEDLREAGGVILKQHNELFPWATILATYEQYLIFQHDGRVNSVEPDISFSTEASDDPESGIIDGQYIITLRSETTVSVQEEILTNLGSGVIYMYSQAMKGFASQLSAAQVKKLLLNSDVVAVEEDRRVTLDGLQSNPPWGLDRIDQTTLPVDGRYSYQADGSGITAYVIDTGVQASHPEFGDRVTSGFGVFAQTDCQGHGTHVAGTIGSSNYGVAKAVKIVPVQVLDCDGSGSISTIVAGMDWVISNHSAGVRAVANMSLGGSYSTSLDLAATRLMNDGIVLVVAAGNENQDACNVSPASTPSAVTVGATNGSDYRASFSNYGSCVDLFAPGVGVLSTVMNSTAGSKSGTSMASPHVAGAAAVLWELNPSWTSTQISSALVSTATANKVQNAGLRSPTKLVYLAPADGVAPTSPIGVSAVVSGSLVTVSWSAPTNPGSSAVVRYEVVTSGDLPVCEWSSGPLQCQSSSLASGTYSFKVSAINSNGSSVYSSTSNSVEVVNASNGNDNFIDRQVLIPDSGSIEDDNLTASREMGEPQLIYSSASTKWYQLTASQNASVTIDLSGSAFDTVLAIFTGSIVSGLSTVSVDDDSGTGTSSKVTFQATAGESYKIQVGGYTTLSKGIIQMSWSSSTILTCSDSISNDDLLAAKLVSGISADCVNTRYATDESFSEPYFSTSCKSIWYVAIPRVTTTVTIDTELSDFDTVLSVHRTSSIPNYWSDLTQVAYSDDNQGLTSRITELQIVAGFRYYIRVAGFYSSYRGCSSGNAALRWDVAPTETVPAAPQGVTALAAETSSLVTWNAPTTDGGSTITQYVVSSYPGGYSCTTETLSCNVLGMPYGSYTFTVAARNAIGTGPESTQSNETVVGNTNDGVSSAVTLQVGPNYGNNRYATSQSGEPVHAGRGGGKSMWYLLTMTSRKLVTVSSSGSLFDTVIGVYSTSDFTGFDSFLNVTSNDDATELENGASQVSWVAEAGVNYLVAVDGYFDGAITASGAFNLSTSVEEIPAPSAPMNIKVSAANTSVNVAWSRPASGHSLVTSYSVTSSPLSAGCTALASDMRCEVIGLSIGVTYTFTVRATNVTGDSPWSVPSTPLRLAGGLSSTEITTSWSADRIDQRGSTLDGFTTYRGRGSGVRVYVVDTGIRNGHRELAGRVESGNDSVHDGNGITDCNGHGTHVASLVAGKHFGVAPLSSVVPVRVVGCDGMGTLSALLEGLTWIAADVDSRDSNAVVNISLGISAVGNDENLEVIDQAIDAIYALGIPVVVSAGNGSTSACSSSPARVADALTVAASDSLDATSSFSNYGSCIDVYAPGTLIPGAHYVDDQSTSLMSGTSMAAPAVAGYSAVIKGMFPTITPASVASLILETATAGVLSDVPSATANRLLYVGSSRCDLSLKMSVACGNLAITNQVNSGASGSIVRLDISGAETNVPVTFEVVGTGCSVTGQSLTSSQATVCRVTANQAEVAGSLEQMSLPFSFTFENIVSSTTQVPTPPTTQVPTPPTTQVPTPPTTQVLVTANILRSQRAISISNKSSSFSRGQRVKLTTSGGSGTGKIKYKVLSSVCSTSGGWLTLKRPGLCKVIATKAASGSYAARDSKIKVFKIK